MIYGVLFKILTLSRFANTLSCCQSTVVAAHRVWNKKILTPFTPVSPRTPKLKFFALMKLVMTGTVAVALLSTLFAWKCANMCQCLEMDPTATTLISTKICWTHGIPSLPETNRRELMRFTSSTLQSCLLWGIYRSALFASLSSHFRT